MIAVPKHSWILAASFLGCVACGGGEGGGGENEVVRLAAGYRVGDGEESASRALLLRKADGDWQSVGDDVLRGDIFDVAFATAADAWAWGSFTAFRSRDAGRTWDDMWASLPDELQHGGYSINGIAFVNATTGYVAGSALGQLDGLPARGPFVWRTSDGGRTWNPVEGLAPTPQDVFFELGVRAGTGEILRIAAAPESGMVTQRVEGVAGAPQIVTRTPSFPRDFTSVGNRGWVVLNVYPSDAPGSTRPAIFRSEKPGAPWVAQAVPDVPSHDFTLDFCDRQVGIAGGALGGLNGAPIVFSTDDGGTQWQRTDLDDLGTSAFADIVCVSASEMWIAANGERARLVRSTDGARSFQDVDVPESGRTAVFALATNAGFRKE
jgi:photosystem II stability/assembly factor-like uncharacterized protein